MSDRWAVVLAAATAAGAFASRPLPLAMALVIVAAAFASRYPLLLCVGAALLASALGARAWAGLDPQPPSRWHGPVTVVTDPADIGGAVRLEVRAGRRRLEAWARGSAASALRPRLAGERVVVAGRVRAVGGSARARLAHRHIGARLSVEEVGEWRPGHPVYRMANGLRRLLLRGVASLPRDQQALFAGFVLGDDRGQEPALREDFRAAGLSHLLAVSGQNVAFVLALAGPLLRRAGLGARTLAGLAILAAFGVLTRWEPSVLRAEAMAGIAMVAAFLGRPASSLRLLALAVSLLLVVDPLLVRSIGFLLSVGACAGIAVAAPAIASRLPGPRLLCGPVGVTLAAQFGVAPVLVPVFGGVPVASLPANLLAVPAAGPVMVWGLAAGPAAGLLGDPFAAAVHLPTRALIAWVAAVARWGAALPLGSLRLPHVALLGAALVLAGTAPSRRRLALGLATATVLAPAIALVLSARRPLAGEPVAAGARLWRSGAATVLTVHDARAGPLLRGVRATGVRRIDIVVCSPRADIGPLLARVPAGVVLRRPGSWAQAGNLLVEVRPAPEPARVRVVGSARAPPARQPALRPQHPRAGDGHPEPHARLVLRPRRPLQPRRLAAPGRAGGGRGRRSPRRRRHQGRARA